MAIMCRQGPVLMQRLPVDCVLPCMARHSTVFNDSRALGCRGFARGLVLHAA